MKVEFKKVDKALESLCRKASEQYLIEIHLAFKKNPDLEKFIDAMGAQFFLDNNGSIIELEKDVRRNGEYVGVLVRPSFRRLVDFLNEWEKYASFPSKEIARKLEY